MQNDDVIDELKKEIADLKGQIFSLCTGLKVLNETYDSESENITEHIGHIYKYLKMLDDRSIADLNLVAETMMVLRDAIAPIEGKIFPGVAKAREQLAALAEKRASVVDEKNKKGS